MPLELTPNEVVGYRFRADWHSMNVVAVKRRGANSRNAGQEYEETLAYCKDVSHAASWLLHHIICAEGEAAQGEAQARARALADMEALMPVVRRAEEHVLQAARELARTLAALGLSQKQLVQALSKGAAPAAAEPGATAAAAG